MIVVINYDSKMRGVHDNSMSVSFWGGEFLNFF